MSIRPKEKLFIIADLGKVRDLSFKPAHLVSIRKSGVRALRLEAFSKSEYARLGELSLLMKKQGFYVLARVKSRSAIEALATKVDSFCLSLEQARDLCQRQALLARTVPLFIYIKENNIGRLRSLLPGLRLSAGQPLALMCDCPGQKGFEALKQLKGRNLYLGYQDCTPGVVSALIAVARGARIIEKKMSLESKNLCISKGYTLKEFPIFNALLHEAQKYL